MRHAELSFFARSNKKQWVRRITVNPKIRLAIFTEQQRQLRILPLAFSLACARNKKQNALLLAFRLALTAHVAIGQVFTFHISTGANLAHRTGEQTSA